MGVPDGLDFVFRDGTFVGEFDALYRALDNPWDQDRSAFSTASTQLIQSLGKIEFDRVVDFGCGKGAFTSRIHSVAPQASIVGIDIAKSAIQAAKTTYPGVAFREGQFPDLKFLSSFRPDLIVMSEVSWYVLDLLAPFFVFLRDSLPAVHLAHKLTTYPEGVQRFGVDFFTSPEEIREYFPLDYIDYGAVENEGHMHSWFLGAFPLGEAYTYESQGVD